jgi:2'-5' RNA ligase
MTAGHIILKHTLPQDMHHLLDKPLDAKGIRNVFAVLAEKHHDKYQDVVTKLTQYGFETSTRMGSSVSLEDLKSPIDKDKRFDDMQTVVDKIRKGQGTKQQKDAEEATAYLKFMEDMNKEVLDAGLKGNKTLAKIILSGSRGSPTQYRQTVAAPGIVPGPDGKPLLDFPLKKSFAEGLSPTEYLAHSFGTRTGLAGTKLAVADSGALSKVIFRAAMTIKVEETDCGTHKGIPVSVDNKDYVGSFLAVPVKEYKHNNEVTRGMLQRLKDEGVKEIVVRSPITCEANKNHHHGAVCQLCVGRRDKQHLPTIGDYIGVTSGTTLGEKMSQMTLGSKHTGSTVKKQGLSGFKLVNQLFNIPDTFRDKAPLAEEDGVVESVDKAGQGGFNVKIKHGAKTREYYIAPGFDLKVKAQDQVEAGHVLSDGLINPADVVRLKGIGEGRRAAATQLKAAFDDAGLQINARNFDVLTRNAIDHVRITDENGIGTYLPNQVVSYNNIEHTYQPRKDSKQVRVEDAKGMYLEAPALHYTIGTKLNSDMLANLKKHNFDAVVVHDKAPGFQPEMQRLLDIPAHEDDWMHQLYSTYLQKRFTDAVNQGMKSDLHGASPIAGLAAGTIGTTSLHSVKRKMQQGVTKVSAELINGTCTLLNPSDTSVDCEYANGVTSRRSWDGLKLVFKSAQLEKQAASHGCLMAFLNDEDTKQFNEWSVKNIPEDKLTDDGRESESHITIMYGFKPSFDEDKLKHILENYGRISCELGKISRFSNDDFDVIKVDVISDDFHKLNALIKKEFGDEIENKYPDYHPHLTIAYVKKGACKQLDGHSYFKGQKYMFDTVKFSFAGERARETWPIAETHDEIMETSSI